MFDPKILRNILCDTAEFHRHGCIFIECWRLIVSTRMSEIKQKDPTPRTPNLRLRFRRLIDAAQPIDLVLDGFGAIVVLGGHRGLLLHLQGGNLGADLTERRRREESRDI